MPRDKADAWSPLTFLTTAQFVFAWGVALLKVMPHLDNRATLTVLALVIADEYVTFLDEHFLWTFPAYKCYLASIKTLLVQVWCMCTDLDTTYLPSNHETGRNNQTKQYHAAFSLGLLKKNRPVPLPCIILSSRYTELVARLLLGQMLHSYVDYYNENRYVISKLSTAWT